MSYDYQMQRGYVFTEAGQIQFLAVRDHVKKLMQDAGAASMGCLLRGMKGSYNSWDAQACVDRLVEIGELLEVPNSLSRAGQDRIFIEPYRAN